MRNLEPGRPLDPEDREFEEVWTALRRLLVSELKRRSLWSLPPACLGIYGCAAWADPDAVEELVADCFVFVFAERFRSLKAQLRHKPNVDGLILRNVRNFLHETQKRHDPVGFRVFSVLRSAVRGVLSAGELQVIAGSLVVRQDTVLAFGLGVSPEEAVRLEELRPHALAWNDDLLPDLITARGWDVRQVTARLERHLLRLAAEGIRAFRFHDLVDALRQDARARWRAVWVHTPEGIPPLLEEEGFATVARLVESPGEDERESLHRLLACLEQSVEQVTEPPARSRDYLQRLLVFLKSHAADAPEERDAPGRGLPSYRQLSQLLAIPRERLPDLFHTLLKLADACRRKISGEESR
ncbi:MAG TPA: hypothetical protein VMW27_27865 [Thermoanaerobaculia bacterium]|nr:hypothetical protein [Thermoanaerobaculia bacterium]